MSSISWSMHCMVYPRVCGGTLRWMLENGETRGLSPRVRGNHGGPGGEIRRRRSIPACAGEPYRATFLEVDAQVYPRVCGGTYAHSALRPLLGGLSPRVRGNRGQIHLEIRPHGSIPACAGEPVAQRWKGLPDEVYPRVCGGTPPSR